jgi:predicted metal-dependent phosphoesterase TrpH
LRVDPHVHTYRSGHSLLKPKDIARIAKRKGIGAVAITDHDVIEGAFDLSKLYPTVIGEEVSTDEGDIIGLFLTGHVPRGPALEVMDSIRSQGGLVVIPHPFDSFRKEAVNSEEICSKADIIEVFNSRVVRSEDNTRADSFAESRSLPKIAGSDAHTSLEIGRSWVEIESIETPSEFMASLKKPKMTCRRSPMIVHAQTKMLKAARGVFH